MLKRLWIYQRERFPLHAFGLLAFTLGYSAVAFSSLLRGAPAPNAGIVLAAAASAFLIFLQMRVLDEFKDIEDDILYRPYRPVPRGLVTLRELRGILVLAGFAELALAFMVEPRLVWFLAAVWAYLSLMTAEFFVPQWLRARPFAYIVTHNPIGFLISFYVTAFEWLPAGGTPHPALAFLALASLFDTSFLEIGRKIRAPQDEEPGVVTYSVAWGRNLAVAAWFGVFLLTTAAGWLAARQIGFAIAFTALMAPVGFAAAICCWRYVRKPETHRARLIEGMSGIGTFMLYFALGPIPLFLAH